MRKVLQQQKMSRKSFYVCLWINISWKKYKWSYALNKKKNICMSQRIHHLTDILSNFLTFHIMPITFSANRIMQIFIFSIVQNNLYPFLVASYRLRCNLQTLGFMICEKRHFTQFYWIWIERKFPDQLIVFFPHFGPGYLLNFCVWVFSSWY